MTNPDYGIIFQAYLLNFKYLKRDISKINEKFLPKDINKNPIIITKHKNNIHIFEIHRDFFIKILYHRIEITISKIAPKMNLKEKDEKKNDLEYQIDYLCLLALQSSRTRSIRHSHTRGSM